MCMNGAYATNGMAPAGFGPIAEGLGGASQAIDTGNFSAINNAAALSLMSEQHRVEVGLSLMNIDAKTRHEPFSATSAADWFALPSLSYMTRRDRFVFGVGLFSQGGMGEDYGRNSFLSLDMNAMPPALTGLRDQSEVMVGRLIFPVAFQVTDQFSIGASLDAVYGRMTMKQALPRQGLMDMMTPGLQTLGTASADPMTAQGLGMANYAHFNFSKLDGWGLGGQLGALWQVTDQVTLGASYQFKTNMDDLEGNGSIDAGAGPFVQTMYGKVKIENFQWPATWKLGAAFQPTPDLLLVAEWKRYEWSSVMDALRIRFQPFMGGYINVDMLQQWSDQDVFSIGAQYALNPALRLRIGFNYADDPVPNDYLQHLGAAIVETHLSLGAGWTIDRQSQLDFAYTHAFESKETNNNPLVGLTSSMSQNIFSLSYSYRF